jgi:hypothetical protein
MAGRRMREDVNWIEAPLWPDRMQRTDAARYLREVHKIRCQPSTLAKAASVGGGPAFRKHAGRFPLYDRADLDIWAQARLSPKVQRNADLRAGEQAK